jgi:ubiquinone biosynthesis protein COQ4
MAGVVKSFGEQHGAALRRAVWEGYRHGRAAKWLHAEDVETLFAEPLEAARKRLNIARPAAYERAQQEIGDATTAPELAAT